MKISLQWLKNEKSLIKNFKSQDENNILNLEHLTQQLPLAGFEIESCENFEHDQDYVLDLAITANRGDCLNIRGISREIAALNKLSFEDWIQDFATISHPTQNKNFISNEAPQACSFYSINTISNINPNAPTPNWIGDRLKKLGVALIHPVVDICNYVMFEIGQPLHAFDASLLQGSLSIRYAKKKETCQILGGALVQLQENTLVIADESGVQALAGIIGSQTSAVKETTTQIILESAHFLPAAIRGRARQYGLQTEAAQRFEQGVDPNLPLLALNYASDLITKYLAGKVDSQLSINGNALPQAPHILLRGSRIERILGIRLEGEIIHSILSRLGMEIHQINATEEWKVIPPSFRFDVQLEIDLIEELARIYGYEKIPFSPPIPKLLSSSQKSQTAANIKNITQALINQGYHEIISYSFISESLQNLCQPTTASIRLKNPLSSEFSIMRTSLWPSLLNTWRYNYNTGQKNRARYFEIGKKYFPILDTEKNIPEQLLTISGLLTGNTFPKQWGKNSTPVDFFDLKADILSIFHALGLKKIKIKFIPQKNISMLKPGESSEIWIANHKVGQAGCLHPEIQKTLELPFPVYLFEIDQIDNTFFWEQFKIADNQIYKDISYFPLIKRDFSLILERNQAVNEIMEFIQAWLKSKAPQDSFVEVTVTDIYQGKNISPEEKSVTFTASIQNPHFTLNTEQLEKLKAELLLEALQKNFKTSLRE